MAFKDPAALLAAIKKGEVSGVTFATIADLGSTPRKAFAVVKALTAAGVQIDVLQDGELLPRLGEAAALDARLSMLAAARARANGRPLGRKPASLDDRALRTLHGEGKSVVAIAKALRVSEATVRRRLARLGLLTPHARRKTPWPDLSE